MAHFMKIHPVVVALFLAEAQTDEWTDRYKKSNNLF